MKRRIHGIYGVHGTKVGRNGIGHFVAVIGHGAPFFFGDADMAVRVDETGYDPGSFYVQYFFPVLVCLCAKFIGEILLSAIRTYPFAYSLSAIVRIFPLMISIAQPPVIFFLVCETKAGFMLFQ